MRKMYALFMAALLAGCIDQSEKTGEKITLNGAGATFPYPLISKWSA